MLNQPTPLPGNLNAAFEIATDAFSVADDTSLATAKRVLTDKAGAATLRWQKELFTGLTRALDGRATQIRIARAENPTANVAAFAMPIDATRLADDLAEAIGALDRHQLETAAFAVVNKQNISDDDLVPLGVRLAIAQALTARMALLDGREMDTATQVSLSATLVRLQATLAETNCLLGIKSPAQETPRVLTLSAMHRATWSCPPVIHPADYSALCAAGRTKAVAFRGARGGALSVGYIACTLNTGEAVAVLEADAIKRLTPAGRSSINADLSRFALSHA